MKQRSFGVRAVRKVVVATVIAVIAWVGSGALGFPRVFQIMFALYAALGLAIFLLLDAPPVPRLSGWKAAVALIGFYAVVSATYILGAMALPQYDPGNEQEKIEKLLRAKREQAGHQLEQLDQLIKRANELEAKAQTLAARLNRLASAAAPAPVVEAPSQPVGDLGLIARGMEVYDLYECYNCHKIGGKGSVKKRGPVLDNIGNLMTIEDMKKKIVDPGYLYAEGFEKEHKKGQMPDKYKELMTEEELNAVAAYMSTLKNPAVGTPRPVFVKTKVEHGFIVYGYVRDGKGNPVPNTEVQAKPVKDHAEPGSGKTNPQGYYEIFLHLHNEDAGTKIVVSSGSARKEITANYDPNDKVTKRQASVDLVIPTS